MTDLKQPTKTHDVNRHCPASFGSVQTVTIQHFHSLKTQEVALIRVAEDDCDWRFPDGSELAYEWSVIDTAQNAEVCDE
tara:strand:+ start:697 stop:933 length:237 start_codon:yes stop_codon:yes gene_type:complete